MEAPCTCVPGKTHWGARGLGLAILQATLACLPPLLPAQSPPANEHPALAASFTALPLTGPAPLEVQFTDTSVGAPTQWAWYFGDEEFASSWSQASSEAGWIGRWRQCAATLPDGSIVVLAGWNDITQTSYNDVWRSTDQGATWTAMSSAASWSARSSPSCVVLPDGTLVLTGGIDDNHEAQNDVWQSADMGATWTSVNADAPWGPRHYHTTVALPDGSIVLMGGMRADGWRLNDVWRSADGGATWTSANADAPWTSRQQHSSVVLSDGTILLTGGAIASRSQVNDVWKSQDAGATWTQVTAEAEWEKRSGHACVVMPDDSILLLGGWEDQVQVNHNDVWRSADQGETWVRVADNVGWTGRVCHSAVLMPDASVVLLAGLDSAWRHQNDVWRLETAGSAEQHPAHTYAKPGVYQVTLQIRRDNETDTIRQSALIQVHGPQAFSGFVVH